MARYVPYEATPISKAEILGSYVSSSSSSAEVYLLCISSVTETKYEDIKCYFASKSRVYLAGSSSGRNSYQLSSSIRAADENGISRTFYYNPNQPVLSTSATRDTVAETKSLKPNISSIYYSTSSSFSSAYRIYTSNSYNLTIAPIKKYNTVILNYYVDDSLYNTLTKVKTVRYGQPLSAYNQEAGSPTKQGHTFKDWAYSGASITADDIRVGFFNLSDRDYNYIAQQTLRLDAIFERNTYIVSFNSNGGSAVSPQNILYGDRATQPATPTKEGYEFAGWFTDSELTNEYDFNTAVGSSFTLYAKWSAGPDVYVKIDEVWVHGPLMVKANGQWYECKEGYIKVGGEWKPLT